MVRLVIHQMESFSALLALYAGNSPVIGEFPSQSQWRGYLMFSLRRHRAHYGVTAMSSHHTSPRGLQRGWVGGWGCVCGMWVCVCVVGASLSHCMILQWCNHGEQQFMTLVPQNLASSGIINSLEANWISNYGIKKYNFHPISDCILLILTQDMWQRRQLLVQYLRTLHSAFATSTWYINIDALPLVKE